MQPRALVVLALLACQPLAAGPGTPIPTDDRALLGAWRSNAALTLEQVAGAHQLSEPQRNIFERPGFWGALCLTYENDRVVSVYRGVRSSAPYERVDAGPGWVQIEVKDPLTGEVVRPRYLLKGNQLWVPVRDLDFYEIFERVPSCAGDDHTAGVGSAIG
jgi:hypothetical protein